MFNKPEKITVIKKQPEIPGEDPFITRQGNLLKQKRRRKKSAKISLRSPRRLLRPPNQHSHNKTVAASQTSLKSQPSCEKSEQP
jgi:hypothetical protein